MAGRPPLVVAWETTRTCPLACRHCRATAQTTPHPSELTTGEGLAFLEDVSAAFPGAVVILTGGEPLTRPDVLELAASGSALGLQMALSVDVGRLLTPELCEAIREAGVKRVSFSLHFPDAERCDEFTSTPASSTMRSRVWRTCAPPVSRSSCTRPSCGRTRHSCPRCTTSSAR